MAGKNENFSELNRKNMEAAMRLAQMSIENSQRVMALQSELARELFQQGVENARAQTTAKDPQEVLQLRNQYAQDTAQKMMVTAQRVAEIGNDARTEFSRMLTEQLASGSQDMIDAFQGFFKRTARAAEVQAGAGLCPDERRRGPFDGSTRRSSSLGRQTAFEPLPRPTQPGAPRLQGGQNPGAGRHRSGRTRHRY